MTEPSKDGLQDVVKLLLESGFDVSGFGFRRTQAQLDRNQFLEDFDWEAVHDTPKRPFITIYAGEYQCGTNVDELRIDESRLEVAQCLLDAGYRCFWSKVSIEGFHVEHSAAEASPVIPYIEIEVHFIGGYAVQRSPDEILEHADDLAEHPERDQAKQERQLDKLDRELRRRGLID